MYSIYGPGAPTQHISSIGTNLRCEVIHDMMTSFFLVFANKPPCTLVISLQRNPLSQVTDTKIEYLTLLIKKKKREGKKKKRKEN